MKENPALQKVMDNMRPGVISLHGFLGSDKRRLEEIIDHDERELEQLGISKEQIADRLEKIMKEAMQGLGHFVKMDNDLMAKADSIRGKLPCPFLHAGVYSKTVITLRKEKTGKELLFTDLGIHLIREHGFFEGKGSLFRLDPAELAEVLGL